LQNVLEHTPSPEEQAQILHTIEMFEVITRTQPDDYQSLEILKEAYGKLGRRDDSLLTSRKLAEAYFNVGSYALAMQECEVLLQHDPNAPEVLAMLGDIETRLQAAGQNVTGGGIKHGLIAKAMSGGDGGLVRLDRKDQEHYNLHERGEEQLAKFLIVQQFFAEEDVATALVKLQQKNKNLPGHTMANSLLVELCGPDTDKLDQVISVLVDRTKAAFIPLEYYDFDRQLARMLPDNLTIGRLCVPFDLISRTIMVACCNPFDAAGRAAVQQSLDYTVSWYLARPAAIERTLQDVYRLELKA
jgi:type II secretion system (T2SS) protein E